ncbi:L,D-transpeptidase family protein [Cytophagaceae bacterium ABcell3]|nr:L,D-transpeptidase family protein [Cytophagaceae bacterium ABcell3]
MKSEKYIYLLGVVIFLMTSLGAKAKSHNNPKNHPQYEQLQEALEKYEEIANNGGFHEVPWFEGALNLGAVSDVVPDIRKRLATTGDIEEEAGKSDSREYDEDVALAVGKFQKRHGLQVDGITGPATLQQMNKPIDDKLEKIKFSLDSWADLPEDLGEKYIFVNIPEFELTAYEDKDDKKFSMRVIVGDEYNGQETPAFNDSMQYIEFNPYWNIPHSIVQRTMLPQAREDTTYLERNNYEIVDQFAEDAEVFENTQENLDLLEQEELFLRQKPGPNNAMGQMKFMFPNEYAIYLHDTPQDHLFDVEERTFSNGCIRVENPVKLAEYLLKDNTNAPGHWNRQRIIQEANQDETTQIYLIDRTPIYIIYWTAFVDEDGNLNFRDDIYDENV